MKNTIFYSILLISEISIYLLLGSVCLLPKDIYLRTVVIYAVFMASRGHYSRHSILIWDEIRSNFQALLLHCIIVLVFTMDILSGIESLKLIGIDIIMLFVATAMSRGLRIVCRKYFRFRTIIIGDGWKVDRYLDITKNNRFSLVDVVGVISSDEKGNLNSNILFFGAGNRTVPLYGINEMERVLEQEKVDQIIVLISIHSREKREKVMKAIHGKAVRIKTLAGSGDLITFASKMQDYDGLLLCSNSSTHMGILVRIIKRIIDIAAGIVGCLMVIPLYIKIKRDYKKDGDMASVIFAQERIGRNGKPIKIYKFRTMIENAESVLEDLMESDPLIKEEYLTNKKLANDPRVTKLGDKLRRTSLDEFPQFWNVLKGEMSLVGPRPYLYREKEDMGMYYDTIVSSKPGITGMWQANGRSDVSFEERCRFDDYYYKNWNLTMEFIIIYKTIKGVIYGKGAM